MATVEPGYMGYAEIGGTKIRCTDFNVQLKQDVLFYDHVIGLRDSIPSGILDGKGDIGAFNEQKIFWRPATKIVEGTVSFPISDKSSDAFLFEATRGETFDLSLYYSCTVGKTFTDCKVNSYTFSATAGEVATVSVNIMGKDVSDASPSTFTDPEKLITWDKVNIGGPGGDIVSFEFTINNNCIPIYTAGTNIGTGSSSQLIANDIRVGMQSVTGSVSFYNNTGPSDAFVESATQQTITVSADALSVTLTVLYQYPERNGQVSAYIKTVPFFGVGQAAV